MRYERARSSLDRHATYIFSGDLMLAADRNRMVDLRAGQGLGALPRWSFQRLP
jgi:hypothetical protein